MDRVLVTGASGLIGHTLAKSLEVRGHQVVRFDLRGRGDDFGDVRDGDQLRSVLKGVAGVIHLAAVSRVVAGERNPELCRQTNVGGLRTLLERIAALGTKPWLVFASSREVYGQADLLPATEESPLRPVNVYGRSKVEGERLVAEAQCEGLRACTIRLSNVFGSTSDHADRVVPAFARAAALGTELRVDGFDHTFDFTHIDDVSRGLAALAELLGAGGTPPPPIHFVSGRATTLGELATLAVRLGHSDSTIRRAPPRDFDIGRFVGDPARAKALLGWQPLVSLEDGLARLIRAYRVEHVASDVRGVAP